MHRCLCPLRLRAFSAAAAAAAPAALSPARLQRMDAAHVAAYAGSALALSSASQALLQARGINGATLLRMDLQRLEAAGMQLQDAGALFDAVERARHGGPVTVQLLPGPGSRPGSVTFDTPRELESFLARQGAAGLRGSDHAIVTRFSALREGEEYTVLICEGGSLAADVARVKAASATDAKVLIDNVKRAVVAASAAVLGEALTADARNDILLKWEGEALGDVDCLFTGPTLHLLLERKRRLSGSASLVIKQLAVTSDAYARLGLSVGPDGRARRVECMVFAEAMDAAAQDELLAAGIYVLRREDMRVLAPPGAASS